MSLLGKIAEFAGLSKPKAEQSSNISSGVIPSDAFPHANSVNETMERAITVAQEHHRPVSLNVNGVRGLIVDEHSNIGGLMEVFKTAQAARADMNAVLQATPEYERLRESGQKPLPSNSYQQGHTPEATMNHAITCAQATGRPVRMDFGEAPGMIADNKSTLAGLKNSYAQVKAAMSKVVDILKGSPEGQRMRGSYTTPEQQSARAPSKTPPVEGIDVSSVTPALRSAMANAPPTGSATQDPASTLPRQRVKTGQTI
ncbi:MAG: hypothetical protein MK052_00720 [Alphaproteobacteria bacterium]|nr:hypothetical protein [Alphaproteobacteria bacterium]